MQIASDPANLNYTLREGEGDLWLTSRYVGHDVLYQYLTVIPFSVVGMFVKRHAT